MGRKISRLALGHTVYFEIIFALLLEQLKHCKNITIFLYLFRDCYLLYVE